MVLRRGMMKNVGFLKSEFTDSELELLAKVYKESSSEDLDFLVYKEGGRTLLKEKNSKKPFTINFLSGDLIFRLKTTGKKQPLLRALMLGPNKTILDGTAGLGRDALVLAFHGAHVIAIERNPILFLMLKEALAFLNKDSLMKSFKGSIEFLLGDAATYIEALPEPLDAIYLDPMYPHEDDKDAKSKKDISILKSISAPTENLEALIQNSLKKVKSRVVLKRPPQSEFIGRPTSSNTANLVRFDIYIPERIE